MDDGSGHTTATGAPVYKPGERYVDMDEDGRWDGYDEANNEMDWNGPFGVPDGKPDLRVRLIQRSDEEVLSDIADSRYSERLENLSEDVQRHIATGVNPDGIQMYDKRDRLTKRPVGRQFRSLDEQTHGG